MNLTPTQRKFLRARAHPLKPLVIIGANGLHEGVLNEIDSTLEHHELIKIRLNAGDRDARAAMAAQIVTAMHAELVQLIGHVGIFYRRANPPQLQLPRAR